MHEENEQWRLMRTVSSWERSESPAYRSRCMRLLESLAAAEEERTGPAMRESDVRGLQTLLRNGGIPAPRRFVVQRVLAHATGEALGDALPPDEGWSAIDVRAWTERHGGNVSALARRLRVTRQKLQAWSSHSASARTVPPYVQAHMETLDDVARLEGGQPG